MEDFNISNDVAVDDNRRRWLAAASYLKDEVRSALGQMAGLSLGRYDSSVYERFLSSEALLRTLSQYCLVEIPNDESIREAFMEILDDGICEISKSLT